MSVIEITTLDDPRLASYRELKASELRGPEQIVAEGEKLVRRLIESSCRVDSVLCTSAAVELLGDVLPPDLPVYVAPTSLISQIIGFKFHRGALACGIRPAVIGVETLGDILRRNERVMLVVCPELRDPDNLGTIIRTAAAFGAQAVIMGRRGTNPFSRRVMRTSMGANLRLPIIETDDWDAVFTTLQAESCTSVATVLDPSAENLLAAIRPQRVALLLGNEDEGLPEDLVRRCQHRVTMPMADGVDSLNVAVAAGIVMHHFRHGDAMSGDRSNRAAMQRPTLPESTVTPPLSKGGQGG